MLFRRGDSPKNATPPKMPLAKFLVRPKESSVAQQPINQSIIKKRAALFSENSDGSWIPTSSTTSVTSTVVTSSGAQPVNEPMKKKRATLFTANRDGSWIPTPSSTSVTSTVVTSSCAPITPVPPLRGNQVTVVNTVIEAPSNTNTEIDCETAGSEGRAAEGEPPSDMRTMSEPDQASTAVASDEREERRKKSSNVTVKEGKKYATLISIDKKKGEKS